MNIMNLTAAFTDVVSVKGFTYALLGMFLVCALGYLLGSIKIKGVSLGTAGVFLVAILYGYLVTKASDSSSDFIRNFYTYTVTDKANAAFSHFQNIGLVMFVTAVGFVAGPSFFHDLKKNATSYVLIGVIIILIGAILAVLFALIPGIGAEFSAGILSGALTSTPGFSAAQGAATDTAIVALGHAIAYPFGVVGVVLFVQLIPKFLKADPAAERMKMKSSESAQKKEYEGKLFEIDPFGLGVFAIAVILGILLGSITIPLTSKGYAGAKFNLGNTGGPLIVALILGHFGRIGKLSLKVPEATIKSLRELGLMLFLVGAGVEGGISLVDKISASELGAMIVLYGFIAGVIMTLVPMIVGFLFAKHVLHIPLFNNLGSICGGMTSTPALGTLISTTGTEDVAGAYAATYPIALILIVLASNLIVSLM